MARSHTEIARVKPLELSMLQPGPENVMTGIPLNEARRFANKIAAEKGIELEEVNVGRKGFVYRNTLNWTVGGKNKLEDYFFITDVSSPVLISKKGNTTRGERKLGSYILCIPSQSDDSSTIQLEIYRNKAV